MRPIKQIISHFSALDTEIGRAVVNVLEQRLSEKEVFRIYVREVSEKNEELFYTCRDAARYLAGSITLEEFLPNVPFDMEDEEEQVEMVTIPKSLLDNILKRLDVLERRTGVNKPKPKKIELHPVGEVINIILPDNYNPSEYVQRKDVARELGITKATLTRWLQQGRLATYRRGNNAFVKISEVENFDLYKKLKQKTWKTKK